MISEYLIHYLNLETDITVHTTQHVISPDRQSYLERLTADQHRHQSFPVPLDSKIGLTENRSCSVRNLKLPHAAHFRRVLHLCNHPIANAVEYEDLHPKLVSSSGKKGQQSRLICGI